jgi:hypothetical protein
MALDDTLAGILNLTDANNDPIEVTDLLEAAPLLAVLPAKKSSYGTTHQYNKEVTAPGVGFRAINTGLTNTAGEEELVTATLKFLDAGVRRDIAVAKADPRGPDAYMASQAGKSLRTAFANVEGQVINGTAALGFDGIADSVFVDDVGDGMVVDAGGAAGSRNVYLIRAGLEDVCVLYNDENVQMSEVYRVEDGTATYTKLVVDIDAYLGLQIGSQYSVARIYNLDGTSTHTLTDDLIAQAAALAPIGSPFTHVICDRTTRRELQQSRTAVGQVASSAGAWATTPMESNGLTIICTDQIAASNTVATTTTT